MFGQQLFLFMCACFTHMQSQDSPAGDSLPQNTSDAFAEKGTVKTLQDGGEGQDMI